MYGVFDKVGILIGLFTLAEKAQAEFAARSFGGSVKLVKQSIIKLAIWIKLHMALFAACGAHTFPSTCVRSAIVNKILTKQYFYVKFL